MPEKNSRLRQVQEEAEEVKVIMMDNMEKTEARKEKLQDLDERAEELKLKSKSFHKTSIKLKEQKKCDNIKANWKLIAVVAASAIIIILVAIFMLVNRSSPENTHDIGITPTHEGGITPTHEGGITPTHEGGITPTHEGGITPTHEGGITPTTIGPGKSAIA